MKRSLFVMSLAMPICAYLLHAQAAATMSGEFTQAYTAVKNNIMKSADKMPDDGYAYKPTPEVRAYAEVLDHVADSQMRTCATVLGEQKTPNAAGKMTKAEVTAALNDAFAECDKAYGALSDANASEMIKTPRGQRSRIGALAGNTAHDSEQYGIIAMYLRMKGLVPPSSDHAPGR